MNDYISLINGEFKNHISVLDRGLSYGDGFFETMCWSHVSEKNIFGVEFWQRHLKRIKKSCITANINFPGIPILKKYRNRILQKSINNGVKEGTLKILITRGVGGRGYKYDKKIKPTVIFLSFPKVKIEKKFIEKGIEVKFCKSSISKNSQLSGLKHLNRLDSVMARSEWSDKKIYEGIFLDNFNNIIEGTMTNIFFVKNNILYTPLIDECGIKGVMRQVVIEKSKLFFKKFFEINIKKENLKSFDEMFITNSIIKILPVRKCIKKRFKISESTRNLIKLFSKENQKNNFLELI